MTRTGPIGRGTEIARETARGIGIGIETETEIPVENLSAASAVLQQRAVEAESVIEIETETETAPEIDGAVDRLAAGAAPDIACATPHEPAAATEIETVTGRATGTAGTAAPVGAARSSPDPARGAPWPTAMAMTDGMVVGLMVCPLPPCLVSISPEELSVTNVHRFLLTSMASLGPLHIWPLDNDERF